MSNVAWIVHGGTITEGGKIFLNEVFTQHTIDQFRANVTKNAEISIRVGEKQIKRKLDMIEIEQDPDRPNKAILKIAAKGKQVRKGSFDYLIIYKRE